MWVSNAYRVHQRLRMAYGEEQRLLFRIEGDNDPVTILVQSHVAPEWEQAFGNFSVLQEAPEQKSFELALHAGGIYRFRLLANPTVKRAGKRMGLLNECDQRNWLARKLQDAGAELRESLIHSWELQRSEKNPANDHGQKQTHVAVQFDGVLTALNPEKLCLAVEQGIGPAKGFGFGLLSLARA